MAIIQVVALQRATEVLSSSAGNRSVSTPVSSDALSRGLLPQQYFPGQFLVSVEAAGDPDGRGGYRQACLLLKSIPPTAWLLTHCIHWRRKKLEPPINVSTLPSATPAFHPRDIGKERHVRQENEGPYWKDGLRGVQGVGRKTENEHCRRET